MINNIQVRKTNLTQKQIDSIIENPKTLNLIWIKSSNQRKQARRDRKIKNFTRKHLSKFLTVVSLIFLFIVLVPKNELNAYNEEILSIQDQIRVERLQACSNALKESDIKPTHFEYIELVKSCTLRMTWVYIVESWYGKHEIRFNNFLGLKRKVNWIYWFHSFETWYDCRYYFAQKYFEFHYKKSPRTFIYWFWIDNQWKYWRSATQKESYTQTLTKIENNKELARQYEYLLITK